MRTEAQIMKAEKLSAVMVTAIALIGTGKNEHVRLGTIVALINRGIVTTATPGTAGRNLLTVKGADIFREMNSRKPNQESTEEYVTANTVTYKVGDIVTPSNENDDMRGVVTEVSPNRWGQLVHVAWNGSHLSYPTTSPDLKKVDQIIDEATADSCGCGTEPPMDLPSIETAQATEYPQPKSATLVNFGAAQMLESITADKAHQKDRDAMARSIAYEFSHLFLKWGVGDPVPEQTMIPRANRPRMLEFYRNGSIWSAAHLLAEIRSEMDDQLSHLDVTDQLDRMDALNAVTWLGWLHAYVLESGKLGDDGWQDRRRSPQDGWSELPLYSTEPSEAEELPAWADVEDGDSFGCTAVISPQGRYQEAEDCGDGVTREEYYAQGSESAMCEQHRLAKIALDDKGW